MQSHLVLNTQLTMYPYRSHPTHFNDRRPLQQARGHSQLTNTTPLPCCVCMPTPKTVPKRLGREVLLHTPPNRAIPGPEGPHPRQRLLKRLTPSPCLCSRKERQDFFPIQGKKIRTSFVKSCFEGAQYIHKPSSWILYRSLWFSDALHCFAFPLQSTSSNSISSYFMRHTHSRWPQ